MTVCEYCRTEMIGSSTCVPIQIRMGAELFDPIPYGSEPFGADWSPPERCHDCDVVIGGIHHGGCDMEACPRCGRQLITCDCET